MAIAWLTVRSLPRKMTETPARRGMPFEAVSFTSADGTRLAGWFIPAGRKTARGVILLCHGIDNSRLQMLDQAAMLRRHGYAVFLFDFRARGESGGDRCTIGCRETDDLLAAIGCVRARPDCRALPLGVLGQSMGGAVALMGAARSREVRAVVAESPFARLDHAVNNHFRAKLGILAPAFAAPTQWIGERLIGTRCAEVAPVAEIGRIAPRPVLLIQDGADCLCPPEETRALMAAAGNPKELWTVPKADHIMALPTAPEEYERRVTAFFDRAMSER
jgi:fermentation-respiration switch protein FrsA (DUF1100 family)